MIVRRPILLAVTLALGLVLGTSALRLRAQIPVAEAPQPVDAAPEAAQPPVDVSPDTTPPPVADADDLWGFDEAEKVETWADILRPQVLDLVLMTSFFAFALVSFFKKSRPLKYVALVAAIAYLGFTRSFLISITNIFSVIDWNWPIVKYNLAWYLFAGFTFFSTILWGRLYCGRLCAYGAFTQLMDAVIPAKYRYNIPKKIEKRASYIKYGLLGLLIVYYLVTHDIMIYRYVEPFWMFGLSERMVLWIGLGVLLTATIFVRNLYCRFLCPVGASLGLISQVTTIFSIKRWSECKTCRICEKACEWGAIEGPRIIKSECVRCDDCERIYDDKKKCVHWLMIVKKEKIAARQAGVGVPRPA
jgi:NosR/NirI family nitrous oxide reductase transcriptional regulator